MENLSNNKSKLTLKLKSKDNEDIYDLIKSKAKQFYELVHPKEVSNRIFYKKDDFKSLIASNVKVTGNNFNCILFNPDYSNVIKYKWII